MDPTYLLKDELEYELLSRGIKVKSTAPVMRRLLQEILVSEQDGAFVKEAKAPEHTLHSVKFELEVCAAKLSTLANYISEIVGKPDRPLFKRLVSRLYHVQNRLNLVEHDNEDNGLRKEGLKQQCQVLLQKLEGQDDLVEDDVLTAGDKEVLQETLGDLGAHIIEKLQIKEDIATGTGDRATGNTSSKVRDREDNNKSVSFMTGQWENEKGRRATLFRHSTVEDDFPIRKLVPIHQWGLKFSGGTNMSVNAFLERVSELKDARNATDIDLWRYAIDFFEGDALIWYRANKEYANSWEELVILMKRTFQRPFYQEELLGEIKARTQGSEESVLIFIAVMQNMFKRLPVKINELEQVQIVLKNLQPYYQRAVCRDLFSSLPDLVNVLRIVERTKINCDNFQQPKALRNVLEPDLAYKSEDAIFEVKDIEVAEERSVPAVSKRCWNCRENGHVFRECSIPKQRLFCYKCGRFGVTTKDCECKGNAQGRNLNAAS